MLQERMFDIECTDCGKSATVPFEPTKGKPVYCKTCFSKHRIRHQERSIINMHDTKNRWAMHRDDWQGRKEEKHHDVFRMT